MKCLLAGNRPRFEVLPAPPPPHSAPAQPHKPRPGSSPPFPRGGPSSGLGAGPARDPGGCWQRRRRRLRLRGLGRNQGQVAESSEAEPSRPASPPTRSDSLGGRALQPAPPRPSRSPGGDWGLAGEGRGPGEQRQEAGDASSLAPTQLGSSGALMGRGRGGKPSWGEEM